MVAVSTEFCAATFAVDPWGAAAAAEFATTTQRKAQAQPEKFLLDAEEDTDPNEAFAELRASSSSGAANMSADAQAIIAALNTQITGVNQNIQGISTRVDNQFAAV